MTVKRRIALSLGNGPAGQIVMRAIAPLVRDNRLAVLTYHRIAGSVDVIPSMSRGLVSALAPDFEAQMRLVRRQFTVISLDDLLGIRHGDRVHGRKPLVMVTFDDAYRDVLDLAWPITSSANVPITVFVASAYPDGGVAFWWDELAFAIRTTHAPELAWDGRRLRLTSQPERLAATRIVHNALQEVPTDESIAAVKSIVDRLGTGPAPAEVLSWREIQSLAGAGVGIGGHSHAHHRLDRMHPDALRNDLATCRRILEEQLGSAPRAFAYPTGYHSDASAAAVGAAGFEVAFTTERGVSDPRGVDWFRVPRINVGLRSSPALLGLQALALPRKRALQPSTPSTPPV